MFFGSNYAGRVLKSQCRSFLSSTPVTTVSGTKQMIQKMYKVLLSLLNDILKHTHTHKKKESRLL